MDPLSFAALIDLDEVASNGLLQWVATEKWPAWPEIQNIIRLLPILGSLNQLPLMAFVIDFPFYKAGHAYARIRPAFT